MTSGGSGEQEARATGALGDAPPLWQALGVLPGDVVSFTGGGGKTSLAIAVMLELCRSGRPALFAATTKMRQPPFPVIHLPGAPPTGHLLNPTDLTVHAPALQELQRLLTACAPVVLTAGPEDAVTGKLPGVDPAWVDLIRHWGWADVIVVEADGSAGRPLKVPKAGEPVIPGTTTLAVAVAGAAVLGRPLDLASVYRPHLVADLTGLAPGAPVTAAAAARALLDPRAGCLKGLPAGARAVVTINQMDAPGGAKAAETLAAAVQVQARGDWTQTGCGRIVLAAAQTPSPARGLRGDVAALLLCAGESRRFADSGAGHKLLATLGDRPVLQHSAAALVRSGIREVVAVTGARGDEVAAVLSGYPVRVVANRHWAEGMAASVRAGLAALFPSTVRSTGGPVDGPDPEAFLFCMGDQPLLGAAEVRRLVQARYETGCPIVVPVAGGRRRHPVLFDRRLVPELMGITGDQGGRSVLAAHAAELVEVEFADPAPFLDVDTPESLAEAAADLRKRTGDHPEGGGGGADAGGGAKA